MDEAQTSYIYRPIEIKDVGLLKEFLYMAVFVPPGQPRPPREVLNLPEIRRYISGWGREHDAGVLAVEKSSGNVIGAAWLRTAIKALKLADLCDVQRSVPVRNDFSASLPIIFTASGSSNTGGRSTN